MKREEKKQLQKEIFRQVYDRPKEKHFSDIDQLNMDSFRAIPKSVILDYGLSKATLAVYPVLCCEADFEKDEAFHISQANIARFAGVSENSVRNALKELENAGLLIKEKVTDGPRHFYVYKVRRPEPEASGQCGEVINFYTCIIENGIWAKLKLRAKVLYLTMCAVAKQDFELYSVIEWEVYERDWTGVNYDDYIRYRRWDVCDISLSKLCKLAKIERTNLTPILEELERYKLIERIDRWIKVYLRPGRLLKHKTLV